MDPSPDRTPTNKPNRRTAILALAGVIAAPMLIDKLKGAFEPYLTTQPLLRVLDQPRVVSDFTFEDATGRAILLKEFKGKFTLLNVWATWCPPCRREMPSLDRFQSLVSGDSRLRVVALSVDRIGFPQLKAFYDVIGIKSLSNYRGEESEVLTSLGIAGLPTTLLLDPDGMETARLVGPTEWDEPRVVSQILNLIDTNEAIPRTQ
jgi:thiol-disulfide isomerase/thioredoxin